MMSACVIILLMYNSSNTHNSVVKFFLKRPLNLAQLIKTSYFIYRNYIDILFIQFKKSEISIIRLFDKINSS
jgi:hypothetical protein